MKFFKIVTGSCLGTLLALVALVGIFAIIGSVSSSGDSKIKTGSYLSLDLNRVIPEKTDNVQQNSGPSLSFESTEAIGLHDIRRILQKAKSDDAINGLVIKSSMVGDIGNAKTSTLIKYLKEFKSEGKKIYAYGDYVGQMEYLVMSTADSIFLNPQGAIDFRGFSRVIPFYKDMYEKLGIEWNVFYAGDFKSATEPFLRTNMSENAKTQSREYLTDLESIYYDSLMVNRDIDRATLKGAQDTYAIRYADDAVTYGLVDDLLYWEEFQDVCKTNAGIDLDKDVYMIDINEYNAKAGKKGKKRGKSKIAVLYAEGVIEYDTQGPGNISEVDYHKAFDDIEDKDVKAVVLRVNSPGGNAYSSEQIWHRVERLKAQGIPVVASYGNYAASGGYYISCNADTIVAQPNTITGSIGVFGMFPDASNLLNEKLGIFFDTVKTSPYAVAVTPFYDLREDEEEIMNNSIDRMYDLFLTRVSDGRRMTKDAVHEVAQGRVWSGVDAVNNGLVDELGDLNDAIAIAAQMADVEDYGVLEFPYIELDMFQKILKELGKSASIFQSRTPMSAVEKQVMDQYKMLKQALNCQEPQYLMPFTLQ